MKKSVIIIKMLLLCGIFLFATSDVYAQKRRSKSKKEPKISLSEKIYFGSYINSPYVSSNNFEGIFRVGLTPFMGYKLTEWFSVGPMLSTSYTYYWQPNLSASLFDFGASAFARADVFRGFFTQVDGGIRSVQVFDGISKRRSSHPVMYVGAGYTRPGQFAQEIFLGFNVFHKRSTIAKFPIDYRLGFKYNF